MVEGWVFQQLPEQPAEPFLPVALERQKQKGFSKLVDCAYWVFKEQYTRIYLAAHSNITRPSIPKIWTMKPCRVASADALHLPLVAY
jgi:hypothetical protein